MSIPKREDQYSSTLHNRGGARAGSGPKPKPIEDRIKPKLVGFTTDNERKIKAIVKRLKEDKRFKVELNLSESKVIRIAIDLLDMRDLRRALRS